MTSDKVFKNGPDKICEIQSLANLKPQILDVLFLNTLSHLDVIDGA